MIREKDIVYEKGDWWVLKNRRGHYEILQNGVTYSTRRGYVGFTGQEGLDRAIKEVERRLEVK